MDNRENEEFTAHLKGAVREAEALKYVPYRFKSMLDASGGFETVKRILASGKPSEGFTKLWELNRLDLTCEAIIVESKWRRYFDSDLIERAEGLLRGMNYQFKRFVDEAASPVSAEIRQGGEAGEAAYDEGPSNSSGSVSGDSGIRINAYFRDILKAPVANVRWSWGSVDERARRVFLRLWRLDLGELAGRKVIRVLGPLGTSSPGWNERAKHIEIIKTGYAAYAVVCDKESPEAGTIQAFDQDTLLRLGRVTENDGMVYMEVVDTVSLEVLEAEAKRPNGIYSDLQEIESADVDSTTRAALVDARLGQGRFRRQLLERWNGACAVTGCRVGAVLRASHCKPWRLSDNRERLDPSNGLVLTANLDALFDTGLITFTDKGEMLLADRLTDQEREHLGLPSSLLQSPGTKLKGFLRFHQDCIFLGSSMR